jgi:hypothetical protein
MSFEADGIVKHASRGWSAVIDGQLTPPPPEHVLDHLVRHYVIPDDAEFEFAELLLTTAPTTVALIDQLPLCDLCAHEGRPATPARYDACASRRGGGPWAYMCGDCFMMRSSQMLGLGLGQYLITRSDLDEGMRSAFDSARNHWIARGADPPNFSPFDEE